MTRYDHTQTGWTTAAGLVFGAFVCLMMLAILLTGNSARPAADRALLSAVLGSLAAILSVVAFTFSRLRVVVTDTDVVVAFGPGWPRRTIALSDVRAARAVRNSWWYGWGIRLVPRGWMFNVSGLDAVELEFASGRVFRIGTDDPQGLLAAIEGARQRGRA